MNNPAKCRVSNDFEFKTKTFNSAENIISNSISRPIRFCLQFKNKNAKKVNHAYVCRENQTHLIFNVSDSLISTLRIYCLYYTESNIIPHV